MKKFPLFSIIFLLALTINAQDVAMFSSSNYNNSSYKVQPLLKETHYTYKYKGDDVLVVFKEDEHIEYFNDKKYFIKSHLEWTAEDECFMTIRESNLPNFPFKAGTKLNMKILKIKRGIIYYESTLGGRSWTGKMKMK